MAGHTRLALMRQVGVADIKPEIAEQAATYLASVFGPDSDTPSVPTQMPGYQAVKQDHESWSDDALNIMYVDYQLTGEPKDRPGTGRPDKTGFIWLEMGGGLAKLNPETGEVKIFRLDDPTRPSIHEVFPAADGLSVWLTVQDQNALVAIRQHTRKSLTLSIRISTTGRGPGKPTPLPRGPNSEITTRRRLVTLLGLTRRWQILQEISGRPADHLKNSVSGTSRKWYIFLFDIEFFKWSAGRPDISCRICHRRVSPRSVTNRLRVVISELGPRGNGVGLPGPRPVVLILIDRSNFSAWVCRIAPGHFDLAQFSHTDKPSAAGKTSWMEAASDHPIGISSLHQFRDLA